MSEILKTALKMWGKTVVVSVMCFFLVISMSTISTAFFSENIGYTAYGTTSENSEYEELYTHYNDDGEDKLLKEYEDKGYTITQSPIRSGLSTGGKIFFYGLTQVMCIVLLITFIHSTVWQMGIKDKNLVHTGHKKEDVLKGFKCGILSVIPYTIFWVVLVILKNGALKELQMSVINLTSSQFYSFVQLIVGKAKYLGDLSILQFIAILSLQLIIPVISGISYYLGYKDISIGEKIIYKKKER